MGLRLNIALKIRYKTEKLDLNVALTFAEDID